VLTVDGRCEMGGLSGGTKVFTIIADGFVAQAVPMTLKTGTISRLTVEIVPLFVNGQSNTPVPENGITQVNMSAEPVVTVGMPSVVVNS